MGDSGSSLVDFLAQHKQVIESYLAALLPHSTRDGNDLFAAMRYAVLNNGKRIRPALVYATGQALDVPIERLHAAAASIELIHCYSLVHDDLPAMDDDDLRRGLPTCHKAYSEATAILVGDALQTLAFQILADAELNPNSAEQRISMVAALAKAAGALGMVQGQAQDIAAEHKSLNLDELINLHANKTGALFKVCCELALIASNCSDDVIKSALNQYSTAVGLAFQIQDDILDITSDDQTLGKPVGSDLELGKVTFPSLMGLEEAQQSAADTIQIALDALAPIAESSMILNLLARHLFNRVN